MKDLVTRLNIDKLTVGTKVKIRTKLSEHPTAWYVGTVKEIYKHHIVFEVKVIRSTMRDSGFGDSRPYNFSVTRAELSTNDNHKSIEVYLIDSISEREVA